MGNARGKRYRGVRFFVDGRRWTTTGIFVSGYIDICTYIQKREDNIQIGLWVGLLGLLVWVELINFAKEVRQFGMYILHEVI